MNALTIYFRMVLVAALVRQVPALIALHDRFLVLPVLVFVILVPTLASRTVILVAVQVEIEPCGIGECDRIVSDVGVLVESLWVLLVTTQRVRRHESSHRRSVVSRPEVVQPTL